MASTSVSSIQKSFKYDVFLSFRGEDTRKNFVDHLYHALKQKSIVTYKDDENVKQGKNISDELIKAIEDSKFYVIVFSKNYASSSWCLEELVKIMECQTMDEHTAYPVFYDVEPTEVRKQSGSVGDAFSKHKEDEAARKWRAALEEASELAGWELKSFANGHEAKFIQKIVEEISLESRFINSSIDGNLIGMETRVNEVISSLEPGVGDVRMLGIWGMGGAGKTTLARAVFDQISFQFEGKSFVENVREESKPSLSNLKSLQKQVLSDILDDQDVTVSGVLDGKNKMKKTMRGRKVLVVLDDVDDKEQLEALAGDCNWFKTGSRIIITTRDKQVLVAHRVSLIHNVTLLSQAEAGCLFSRYAFGKENPIQGYEELSGKVLQYADGLPLTIKVMGSFLCGQDESEWKDAIKRLETIPLKKTMEVLELSYNGLEEDCKQIFLDVACILKGWEKEEAIRVLESRGFRARIGLRVLKQKSLITYEDGELEMHDHLEEMGRNIVRRSHPDEPQRHSRLWVKEEIEYILTNDLGTPETKCLTLDDFIAEIAIKGLAKMKDLKVLDIWVSDKCDINWKFDKVSEYLPSSLRFMRFIGFPFSSLPNTFLGKYLVNLEMEGSNIVQLWEDGEEKVLNSLRFFTIKFAKLRTFDLGLAPNLEELSIAYCRDFVELHIPADHRLKLEYLHIYFTKLTKLHLGNAPNLKTLEFEGCYNLEEFQIPSESLKLEHLAVSYLNLTNLHLGNTPNLKNLTLSYSKLKTIHLGSTPNLERLILRGCYDLVEFEMPSECLKIEEVNLSHSKFRTLDLGLTPNLKSLHLENFYDLVEINAQVGYLKKLAFLYLSGCGRFENFVFDKRSQPATEAGSLSELHLIAIAEPNSFPKFRFRCFYKEDPASAFGNLETLISMGLCACTNLENPLRSICSLRGLRKLTLEGGITEAPQDLDHLECLEELIFSSANIRNLPDSICKLKHLKSLQLKSCLLLEKLPDDLGQIDSLNTLTITDCNRLRDIPNNIAGKINCVISPKVYKRYTHGKYKGASTQKN
ncbi:Toll/interleukin-1 receptor domain-containing protein [Tanacetum coccineum]